MAAAKTRPEPVSLTAALELALGAARWLTSADAAAVQLARSHAQRLDSGQLEPREIVQIARLYADLLNALGLTIAGRSQRPEPEQELSPLDRIKAKAAAGTLKATAPQPKPKRAEPSRGAGRAS